MGTHQHGSVDLPYGSTDAEGRRVDEQLFGELIAAALAGCTACVDHRLDEVAADSVCVSRLVEVSRLTVLRVYRGELPEFMTESAATSSEFQRLVRAVNAAEPLVEACEQMTAARRRAAAATALDHLVGHLTILNREGVDASQTLPQACVVIGSLMVSWWFRAAPMAEREFYDIWRERAFARRNAPPLDEAGALALLLGAVLHQQAVQDEVTVETIRDLAFTRILSVVQDTEQAGEILRDFVAPPEVDDISVPTKRLARSDSVLVAQLCRFARLIITLFAGDCPHGLRERAHECTLAHRAAALEGETQAQVAASATGEGRRVSLPSTRGYREDEPAEDAPASHPTDHIWQINTRWILVRRFDAAAARWNDSIDDDSTISEPNHRHETGLEALACPACGNQENWLAEGRWGDPLTLHCRCGVTVMSPIDDNTASEFGRRILKRLILCEADPAYAARRLMAPLTERREHERSRRSSSWYRGPNDEEVALIEAISPDSDLAPALMTALNPKLPQRYGGRALTLLLLEVAYALSAPIVRDSPDGQRLESAVHTLLTDLREESDRTAPARQPVLDRLQAWQDNGGPPAWQAAWTRMLEVASPFKPYRVGDGTLSDGCAALALALYILSRETGTGVEQVSVDDVRGLLSAGPTGDSAEDPDQVPQRWRSRLQALGHNLDADGDPVAALWRHLRVTRPVGVLQDRRESALVAGLDCILGRIYNIRF